MKGTTMYLPNHVDKLIHVRRKFRRIVGEVNRLEQTVLKLIRHPDATPEQIAQAREILIGIDAYMDKVIAAAAAKGIKLVKLDGGKPEE
jgi:hypothetical protein